MVQVVADRKIANNVPPSGFNILRPDPIKSKIDQIRPQNTKTASQHIDDIAVIRSMYAQVPNHEPSLMLMNCGDSVQTCSSMGAWVLYGLGLEN